MHLKLSRLNHSIKATHFRAYDTELDDIRSILMDACRLLEHHVIFVVSGFGQDRWPVDTGTDLPVFLEQLPHVLKAVKDRDRLLEMLCALSDDFMVLITALSPCIAAHPWVARWKEVSSTPRP